MSLTALQDLTRTLAQPRGPTHRSLLFQFFFTNIYFVEVKYACVRARACMKWIR